jgi:3-oxoacyl-[acyl-carrier protein] reductase
MSDGVTMSLAGKVALVTGGSRGIGAATVRMFCRAGAKVVFNYNKAASAAEKLARECGGERCVAVRADLSTTEHARDLVEAVMERFGHLDILVVNHGIWESEDVPIDRMSEEQWRRTMGINLDSAFALVKWAVAKMKRQPQQDGARGHIVIVSSTAGQRGEAFHCDYAASKGAVISMVKGLSTELACDAIYVNCVAPGWVDTDMAAPALKDPNYRKAVFATIPLQRVGTPDEIAAPILFLCTPHAGFITGEIFNVNGGAVLVG